MVQCSKCNRLSSWKNWILIVGILLVTIGINTKEHSCPLEDWGNGYGVVSSYSLFLIDTDQNPKGKRIASENTFVV